MAIVEQIVVRRSNNMSEIFEGIIYLASPTEAGAVFQKVVSQTALRLALTQLEGSVYALYRNDERTKAAFVPEMDRLGRGISFDIGEALVARYDSRSGYVSSELYNNGKLSKGFDEDDEVYVLLGEDGMPLVQGKQFRYADLDPDEEYDTLYNAIQLGLDEMALAQIWPRLLDLINNQGKEKDA
jgi:hypothetical protein